MLELEYPFDGAYIIKKKKSLRRLLLETAEKNQTSFVEKRVAVLGGSTTHDIVSILDLFLLNTGIKCEFYQSEYNMYYEDVMFDGSELEEFKPEIIYIHTSYRNITNLPSLSMTKGDVDDCLKAEFNKLVSIWEKAYEKYSCPIIQNNFEYPYYRILGNKEAYDYHGTVRFVNRLNEMIAEYADDHDFLYIQDINYLSSSYGLEKWADPHYWHMYKYCMCIDAIPDFSYNLSNIIKSILGKNKKALALDLDNTLWGGVVGDDGVEGIEIGQETSLGQVYAEFQAYLKSLKDIGIILNVNSKNEYENAIAGLNHPGGALKPDDFIIIKANWDEKSKNLLDMATELNLLPESFVFVDDNPAEREIVKAQVYGVAVPDIGQVDDYIRVIDRAGYFEVTNLSKDDAKRNEMYKENAKRAAAQATFSNYGEYLDSLNMEAEIADFCPLYLDRIAQLSNKSNQFNLTTRRYTREEIESISLSEKYIKIYGKLADKFGDNGVVSVVIGAINGDVLDIDLWIMSCRVLKRDMEYAMLDVLMEKAVSAGIKTIKGHYYPTAKNSMVKNFYETMGFTKVSEDEEGNTEWTFTLENGYNKKCVHIKY